MEKARGYQVAVAWSDEDSCFIANAPALEGCLTHGSTAAEALIQAQEAVALWLEEAEERGDYIPRPLNAYSGKMTLRMPVSLHRKIAMQAEREGVSINQWVVAKLAM